ncbi:transposase [Desulfobulbus rhabdoformis]|uniref:REP-associated tyrosine transposase n=1 Tax=Desulfobulbus rhabdoformis TaxID=34032 RepID=UPI0019628711|nr:transposase [Desulfobulbus rhabdoformis]MBM9614747.1 transposase [Desulfobulbus rhabdoformis]
MPNYRRSDATGGTFFFTVVTYRRRRLFDSLEARNILGKVVRETREACPFVIDAWVLLPDHLHCIWTLPPGDSDFSMRWSRIKSTFSKRCKHLFHVEAWMNASRKKTRELTIWQRRFWEHQITCDRDYRIYMDYIHYNPVKHGWVKQVVDWPFSTFHRQVRLGNYSPDWGGQNLDASSPCFGE